MSSNIKFDFSKFFKWLYYPDKEFRNTLTPGCIQGIKNPRKEKTSYKPSDI
jgi:hypothetical protein